MALKHRPAHPMQAAASAFFSVALVAGLMPVLPAAAYAEEQAQPAADIAAVQEAQTPSLLDEGGRDHGTGSAVIAGKPYLHGFRFWRRIRCGVSHEC